LPAEYDGWYASSNEDSRHRPLPERSRRSRSRSTAPSCGS